VIDAIHDGEFVGDDRDAVREVWSSLMEHGDRYMLLADFRSYIETQARAAEFFRDRRGWARAAILNVAAMGYFSSDRAILEYADRIWGLQSIAVRTPEGR
jgi:starch phosphorylase